MEATPSQFVPRARQDDPQEILAPFALNSQLPVRKRLLSWTTKTQADKLRRTKTLLSKTAQELENNSIFEETVKNITTYDTAHRIALFLRKAPVNRRRYAFSNALGWSVGVAGKPYGDVLLRVTLRDEAVLLGIGGPGDPELQPFRAMDLRGVRVPVEELTAHPERIAVVFHEGRDPGGIYFREYVLVNEGMVESWAIGTEDVLAELRKSREALERLVKVSPEQGIQEDTGLSLALDRNPVHLAPRALVQRPRHQRAALFLEQGQRPAHPAAARPFHAARGAGAPAQESHPPPAPGGAPAAPATAAEQVQEAPHRAVLSGRAALRDHGPLAPTPVSPRISVRRAASISTESTPSPSTVRSFWSATACMPSQGLSV
jgi:hypothetical protein